MFTTLSIFSRPDAAKHAVASYRVSGNAWRQPARYFAHRAAISRLREFEDFALKDIGISRSQIGAAVCGVATAPASCWRT